MSRTGVCICVVFVLDLSLFDVKFCPPAAVEEMLISRSVCLQAGAGGDGGQR